MMASGGRGGSSLKLLKYRVKYFVDMKNLKESIELEIITRFNRVTGGTGAAVPMFVHNEIDRRVGVYAEQNHVKEKQIDVLKDETEEYVRQMVESDPNFIEWVE